MPFFHKECLRLGVDNPHLIHDNPGFVTNNRTHTKSAIPDGRRPKNVIASKTKTKRRHVMRAIVIFEGLVAKRTVRLLDIGFLVVGEN